MNSTIMPNFQELEHVFTDAALKLHPSEVHGLMCGAICGNAKATHDWESLLEADDITEPVRDALKVLYENTLKQLKEFLFEFDLMLPDDDAMLPVRAEALTLWCQGFLTGLKLAHVQLAGREPSDVTEAINDLVEIAKMNFDDVISSEEDESAYVELVEYVRMAAVLIYQDINEEETSNPSAMAKHLH